MIDMNKKEYIDEAVRLLQRLIATPSVSRDEAGAADVLCTAMDEYGIIFGRKVPISTTCGPPFSSMPI